MYLQGKLHTLVWKSKPWINLFTCVTKFGIDQNNYTLYSPKPRPDHAHLGVLGFQICKNTHILNNPQTLSAIKGTKVYVHLVLGFCLARCKLYNQLIFDNMERSRIIFELCSTTWHMLHPIKLKSEEIRESAFIRFIEHFGFGYPLLRGNSRILSINS
jgi:hypothetical protein